MMSTTAGILWLSLEVTCLLVHARLHHITDKTTVSMDSRLPLDDMLAIERCSHFSVLLLTDGSPWAISVMQDLAHLHAPLGVGIFEVKTSKQNTNMTYKQLSRSIATARQLGDALWCVTMVVVSDDPAFLAAFAESSFKSHLLLVQKTKLFVFTRIPLLQLQNIPHLHRTLSRTTSLIAVVDDTLPVFRTKVFSWLPFTDPESRPLQVASWTIDQRLTFTHPPDLFPRKFLRFPHRPHVLVTAEELVAQLAFTVDDPTAPEGKRLTFGGPAGNIMEMLSSIMNFTYTYVRSPDRTWGLLQSDGTWTGILGLITREEVEFTPGPFYMDITRSQWIDFSPFVFMGSYAILAALGRPEVDPWSFLLPLRPKVWVAVLTLLLAVCAVMLLLSLYLPTHMQEPRMIDTNTFNCLRVLLQEDIKRTKSRWWWERVMLGVWMLMMVVLTQSYVGNLMSLLAVRYIDQPYQSLEDVLDNSDVRIIVVPNTYIIKYIETATSGPLQELGKLLGTKRVSYNQFIELQNSMETVVRAATHIIFDLHLNYINMLAKSVSLTGRCDFYLSRSVYAATPLAMVTQKNSLFLPMINKLSYTLVESGLYDKWMRYSEHNSSMCKNPPRIITVTTILSLNSLWGMFAVLGCGFTVAVMVLVMELACGRARWGHKVQVAT